MSQKTELIIQNFDTFKEVERVQNVLIEFNDMSADAKSMIQDLRRHLIDKNQGFRYRNQLIHAVNINGSRSE